MTLATPMIVAVGDSWMHGTGNHDHVKHHWLLREHIGAMLQDVIAMPDWRAVGML